MTTTEYMVRKNKILREFLGIDFDLVPESQMVDIKYNELSMFDSQSSCPYCAEYYDEYGKTPCSGCPMYEANNECEFGTFNTWSQYITACNVSGVKSHMFPESKAYTPVSLLVKEYNLSNESKGVQDEVDV